MTEDASRSQEDEERDRLIFDLIKGRLDEEYRRGSDLEGKANNMIGFVAILVGLLVAVTATRTAAPALFSILDIVYFGGISSLILCIFLALFGIRIQKRTFAPDVKLLI